ncbi:hypothetical protein [Maioricimonas sp. JC845]|uniref:hypothetical protein n=1 Tax=Maioricimonas sp. JC845 TaxID=3232138 RepID=UPI00345A52E2
MTAIAERRRAPTPPVRPDLTARNTPDTPPENVPPRPGSWRETPSGSLTTTGLAVAENGLRVAQPLVIGLAINDLQSGSFVGLLVLLATQLLQTLTGTGRRMAACRLAEDLDHRGPSATFYTDTIPMTIRTLFAIGGSLALLAWYDPALAFMCGLMSLPTILLGSSYARKLTDLERARRREEVTDAAPGTPSPRIGMHLPRPSWDVRQNDALAIHVGLTQVFMLGALALPLVRAATNPALPTGDLFAIIGSALMLTGGLGGLPRLLRQWHQPGRPISR